MDQRILRFQQNPPAHAWYPNPVDIGDSLVRKLDRLNPPIGYQRVQDFLDTDEARLRLNYTRSADALYLQLDEEHVKVAVLTTGLGCGTEGIGISFDGSTLLADVAAEQREVPNELDDDFDLLFSVQAGSPLEDDRRLREFLVYMHCAGLKWASRHRLITFNPNRLLSIPPPEVLGWMWTVAKPFKDRPQFAYLMAKIFMLSVMVTQADIDLGSSIEWSDEEFNDHMRDSSFARDVPSWAFFPTGQDMWVSEKNIEKVFRLAHYDILCNTLKARSTRDDEAAPAIPTPTAARLYGTSSHTLAPA